MRDLSTLTFHPTAEKIVELLCEKTQNTDPQFFRIMVCYYLCKMAASMRVSILTKDRGKIPINFYGINLGVSGCGKNFSTNILEEQVINKFRTIFFDETLPNVAEQKLAALAVRRSNIKNAMPGNTEPTDPDIELIAVKKEYENLGKLAFSFDSGTTAAVKQMRHKLLMAEIGSMNLEIDEVGTNLLGNAEVLGTFLELFDVGKLKQKLTKNTKENVRSEEIEGKTPTNLMLFGTPSKVFDGAKVEEEFWSFIDTGYGRRCFFGYMHSGTKDTTLSAEEIYDRLTNQTSVAFLEDLSNKFGSLAQELNYDKHIIVSKEVSLVLIKYRMHCEETADALGDHDQMRKAELSHRYFKALKLAGAYAFIDGQSTITEDTLYHAICLVEESGLAFNKMLNQDRNYVKLAKYISSIGREVTHVDLTESLPFYRGSASQKSDMMHLAVAWGYKNSVIIKHKIENTIEFITGETLDKTDLDSLFLSHSADIAENYKNVQAPFAKLHQLLTLDNHNWCSHHSDNGHRSEEHMVPGCNMVVLDVDSGVTIDRVKLLLANYKFILHTTKRHTDANHRFRVILPLNYQLKLDTDDFKEFMTNLYEWLPFDCDTATGQRSRKWLTNKNSTITYNDGEELLDALLFIPRTSKNDERRRIIQDYQELSNVERWFMTNTTAGNRNNQLLRYAMMLVDSNYRVVDIKMHVDALNAKLPNPLSDSEIQSTIMVSVNRADAKKGL